MAQPIILPSFAAGELAPSMYGRVDLARYHVGAALLRNFFVDYRGGASSRGGTGFVGQLKDSSKPGRLIPFQFNTKQTYALVFGDKSLRFVTNGGYVLEPAQIIIGISNANPGLVVVSAHGYSNGDLVYLSGIGGMVQMNQRFGIVTSASTNNFTLTDMYGQPIDTSSYSVFFGGGGVIARVYTVTTPYAGSDLSLLKFAQSADVMTLVHPSYTPYTLSRLSNYSWVFAPVIFVSTVASPTGLSLVNNGVGSTYPGTYYNYAVTAFVGGKESLPAIATMGAAGIFALGQNVGAQNKIGWTSVPGATIYNIYRTQENLSAAVPDGAIFGYIGAALDATVNTFIDDNILPDLTTTPPQTNNPFDAGNFPACVTYYQQRQVFGNLVNGPETIEFSKTGDFFNMNYSIPTRPDDNIEITIGSQQVNAIKHLVPMQSLIALTSSGAWKIDAGGVGTAITPSQIEAVPQAYNGCSDVPPITVNYDVLYVQGKGSIVRDLSYNFYVNVYTGTDITIMANHLFFGHQITEWCFAEEPFKVIWAVREDGILLSLTYLKEQEVTAWAHHDTSGRFKSICSISEGDENAVYVIVERLINGQYLQYIERFASRHMGGDPTIGLPADASQAWCVDAGLQYPLTMPSASLTPVALTAPETIQSIHLIFGGTGYSAGTSITVIDSTGSGAVVSPVISGGVITSVAVSNGGTGYTNPTFNVFDPASTGSGAVMMAIMGRPVVMNANASIFSIGNVGDIVRVNGGMGKVISCQSPMQITIDVISALTNLWPAPIGAWSITTPVSTISGLDHLNGQTVAVVGDGNVQTSKVVVNGSISLDHPCTAVTIGLPFTCQLQSLYLDIEGGPTIQSKRKKVNAVTVRMQDSRGLKIGTSFSTLTEIKERTTEMMGQPIALFTGDQRVTTSPAWNVQGQICVQQDYPLPCTVLALIPEISIGDTPG